MQGLRPILLICVACLVAGCIYVSDVNPRDQHKCDLDASKPLAVPYDPSFGEMFWICAKDKSLSLRRTSTVELREMAMEKAAAFAEEQGKTLKVLGHQSHQGEFGVDPYSKVRLVFVLVSEPEFTPTTRTIADPPVLLEIE